MTRRQRVAAAAKRQCREYDTAPTVRPAGETWRVTTLRSRLESALVAFGKPMDYFAHAKNTRSMLERLAAEEPTTLACMHGSAWRGDGAAAPLADAVERET